MGRPRIIIESRDGAAARDLATALEAAGLDPVVCSGPGGSHGGCPLMDGARCALLDTADAVVYDLDLDRADDRLVLTTLVMEHDGLPVVTERSTAEARRHGEALKQCAVVVPFSPDRTARVVMRALVEARHPALV